jgi:acyl-CoA reductase-like NAD-dependent aldehyde dehydrogenase
MPLVQLSSNEARVLGALIEKSVTTPDAYPLSLNSLRLACNQSTNRDPVVNFTDDDVQHALDGLRAKNLASRSKAHGERAIKQRHTADSTLEISGAERAVLCVLLLRGAQTIGELKSRTERLHDFADVGAVESTLLGLVDRGFVARLDRRPGQKERRWTELLTEDAGDSPAVSDEVVEQPAEPQPVSRVAATFDVINPATGESIRRVEAHGEGDIAAMLRRARAAQAEWAARPYAERAAVLLRFRDLLGEDLETCARATTSETGRPIAQTRNEIRSALARITYFVEHAPNVLQPHDVSEAPDLIERVTVEPVGVVAHISAWNYPYFVGLNSIVPALACGNAVLYKPSELATLTGLQLVAVAHRSGVPVDVLQTVTGEGPTGSLLVRSGVDMVCFTGSVATGRRIATAAAERLIRVQLELGGKDAAYVCDDVDVPATAVAVAEGVFYNAGQSCCAIERVYVHERVWEQFVTGFVAAAKTWKPGDPTSGETTMGALARAEQPAFLQRQVDDALAKGARLLLGGELPTGTGAFYPPTVLADTDESMAVLRDESFGPIIGLCRVASDAEAVRRIDDSEYGLTAAVFSNDRARAERILESLDVGSVYWNCSDRTSVALPWAGRRSSGLGVSMSEAGIRCFVRDKAWHLRPPAG